LRSLFRQVLKRIGLAFSVMGHKQSRVTATYRRVAFVISKDHIVEPVKMRLRFASGLVISVTTRMKA